LVIRKNLVIDFTFDKKLIFNLLKKSLPIGLATLLSFFYFRIDIILLSILKGSKEVGIYSLSYKVFENTLVFWAFYIGAFYPLLAKYHNAGKREAYINLFKNSIKIAVIAGAAVMFLGIIFSGFLVTLLAGKQFLESVLPLRILLISSGLFFINAVLYYFIFIKEKAGILIKGLVLSLGFNVILNLLLIPRFSYVGAGITTLLTELFLLAFYIYQIRRISF
jgi:O-antigen/teichoic acid export membrane protein